MKLLYVIHQYFPDCFSGTEQYCLAASREARRRGDDVTVLTLQPDFGTEVPPLEVTEDTYDGFRVLRLRHWWGLNPNEVLRDYRNPAVAARFARVLDEVRPDAVHFFHLRNLGGDLLDRARDAGVRSVVHLMDFWYLCSRFTLLRSDGTLCEGPPDGGLGCVACNYPALADGVEADALPHLRAAAEAGAEPRALWNPPDQVLALLRRKDELLGRLAGADAVIAPSRFLRDLFVKNGVAAERLRVVPYGLEPGRIQRSEVRRPRTPLRVGFAGVLSPWKAPHLVVDAVRELAGDVRLDVHGRLDEGMFADYIRALRERADGDPRITFRGAFDRGAVSDVLAATDVLVVPSTWYENTPFVILEARAAGVPVLASNLGGMAELIEEGTDGYLFDHGDAGALREALRACLRDPARLANLEPRPPGEIAENYDRFVEAYGGAA